MKIVGLFSILFDRKRMFHSRVQCHTDFGWEQSGKHPKPCFTPVRDRFLKKTQCVNIGAAEVLKQSVPGCMLPVESVLMRCKGSEFGTGQFDAP